MRPRLLHVLKKLLGLSASRCCMYKGFPYFWPLNNKRVLAFLGISFYILLQGFSVLWLYYISTQNENKVFLNFTDAYTKFMYYLHIFKIIKFLT